MKKYLFLAVAACLGLASCEDVPAPYEIFTDGENPNAGGHVTVVAEGDGSAENPFNVAAVNEFDPGSGVTTSESYYVRGKISQLKEFGESYGNYSYYISDDGSTKNQYYIYRGYDLDGAKFTSADQLAVGDSVVIYGKIVNYNGTLEYAQGSKLVYHNGQTAGTSPEPPSDLGDNLITNGDFESWTDGQPTDWKSACTASSATLSQSEDAHGGKYAVKVAGADQNKRLAYKELNLKAGTYYVTYYAKSGGDCTSSYGRQCRSGYVPVTNGSVGSYSYGDYISLTESDWTKAEFSFKLTAAQTVCLVIMAPANCGDLFVDDFELKTADGGIGEGGSVTPSDPVDANTPETAYTVAKAHQLIEGGTGLDNMFYVKGFISEIQEVSTSYGNATYFISDDKSTTGQLEVYRGYGLGGAKFTSESEIKVGDEVIVYGKLVDYNGTHEFTTGSQIYSLNGQTAGTENPDQPGTDPDQPSGDVQQITIGEFLTKADPNTTYRLVGIVKNIANTTYGNFDLEDATGSIYIYGLLNAAGEAKKFAEMGINEGDELTLEGKYVDYNGKAEIKNAQYISHTSAGGNVTPDDPDPVVPDPQPTGDNLVANGDFEAWTGGKPNYWATSSTAGNATLEQSTSAHGGSYAVQVNGNASSNKRIGYQETIFEPGTYNVKFYAKSLGGAVSDYGPQCRPGFVPVTDGKVGSYVYGEYANLDENSWTEVTYTFTLDAKTTICLVVMNAKGSGNILIDDYVITKQ